MRVQGMGKVLTKLKGFLRSRLSQQQLEQLQIKRFFANGAKPWTSGYYEYKWKTISDIIRHNNFYNLLGTERFGYRIDERVVELPWLLANLSERGGIMLDAGSALNYEPIVTAPPITKKKLFISTLAPEGHAFWDRGISYVYEDLRDTCYRDDFFDYVACISTLEHVGLDNTFLYTSDKTKKEENVIAYLSVIESLRKVLKPGGHLFLTLPYGIYKNHGWFQVFNASMVDSIIKLFTPSTFTESIFMYSEDRWHQATRESAKDAVCYDINIVKTYSHDYCAFSRAVICLDFVK